MTNSIPSATNPGKPGHPPAKDLAAVPERLAMPTLEGYEHALGIVANPA